MEDSKCSNLWIAKKKININYPGFYANRVENLFRVLIEVKTLYQNFGKVFAEQFNVESQF